MTANVDPYKSKEYWYYEGSTDDNKVPHGQGIIEYADGTYCAGEFEKGKMTGRGAIKIAGRDDVIVTGNWKENRLLDGVCLKCGIAMHGSLSMVDLTRHGAGCSPDKINGQVVTLLKDRNIGDCIKYFRDTITYPIKYNGQGKAYDGDDIDKLKKQPHGWGTQTLRKGFFLEGDYREGSIKGWFKYTVVVKKYFFEGFWDENGPRDYSCSHCGETEESLGWYDWDRPDIFEATLSGHARECKASQPAITNMPNTFAQALRPDECQQLSTTDTYVVLIKKKITMLTTQPTAAPASSADLRQLTDENAVLKERVTVLERDAVQMRSIIERLMADVVQLKTQQAARAQESPKR